MATNDQQTPPNQATPEEQALTTPPMRPELLLAVQHQQSTQAINNECASIRQEIGALKAELAGVKAAHGDTGKDIAGIKKTHHIALGVGLAIAALIGVIWFLVGHKISTLLTMADEREVLDAHKEDAVAKAAVANASVNSN